MKNITLGEVIFMALGFVVIGAFILYNWPVIMEYINGAVASKPKLPTISMEMETLWDMKNEIVSKIV